ncbi:FimV N-terminal domain-containing protein [Onishia taeanensis]|uniref:FimV N-terminal domain-containing protein n=1 Tax=Onishia taeanensis TaxID=284577 RepID=A0A1G7UQW9_9GAMM|nr:FimV/HubP family polar landmark protein [Halomonas taeanensis]SDG49529.1 FimV N-terminal domain-containing protein [Halomonas taeanensis]
MNRKFSLVILLTSLSAMSPLAWSLGVGDAKVGSALGAPLEATIPLTDTQGVSAQNLTVSLADADGYRRAGLERSLLVDALTLSVVPQSGGLSVRVQSSRAVRTPYLDLLVDIDGPDGVIQRQVTLLFDPPGFGSQSATPALPSPQQASSPQAEPLQTSMAPRERDPGYVESGETLWSVAERLRPDADISISQMMLALLDANPEAFPGGNINRLRAGYVLNVPTREQMTSRSTEEAWQQVQAQNSAFARGEPVPAFASSTTSQQAPDSADATVDKAAAKPDRGDAGAASGLVQADAPSSQAPQASAAASQDQPATQRLTLLTDAQVASEAAAGASGANEQNQRLDRLEAQLSLSQQSLAAMRDERDRAEAELASLREDVASLQASLSALAERQASSATEDASVAQSESAAQAASEPAATGLADRYLMPLWTSLGQMVRSLSFQLAGLGVLVLLALWWLVRRRRGADQTRATEQVSASAASSAAESQKAKNGSASERFVPDAREALMPRAEAVSEADIFIAYGRYEKAQALLEESLNAEPGRHDLRLKLVKTLVEQGYWQQAHEQAEHLADDNDAARQAELERLMALERAVPTPSAGEASSGGGDADGPTQFSAADDAGASTPIDLAPIESMETFRPPIEREPIAFDGKGRHARPSWQEGKEVDSEQISEALKEASRDKAESSSDTTAAEAPDEPRGISLGEEAEVEAETGRDETERSVSEEPPGKQPDLGDSDEASSEDGEPAASTNDRVIDYHPPSLEADPAVPEETLMQPSVEFPQSQTSADQYAVSFGDEGALSDDEDTPAVGEDAGSNLAELMRQADTPARRSAFAVDEQELDIEEVAFEPLHLDNGQPADPRPEAQVLVSDAESLLEKGDHDQAQALLARALEEGDGVTREQASRLIAQHNL